VETTLHTRIAAIDVGSNALRINVFEQDAQGAIQTIETMRKPIRLGQDVFHNGKILRQSLGDALKAVKEFHQLIDRSAVSKVAAVATSAVREASNGAAFVERALQETGIDIQIIDSSEEARLIITAILDRMDLAELNVEHIEVGGGSVEVCLIEDGKVQFSLTHKLGAIRLLQMLNNCHDSQEKVSGVIQEYANLTHNRFRHSLGAKRIDRFIATGGNIDSVIWLLEQTGWGPVDMQHGFKRISCDTLSKVISELTLYSFNERVEKLRLRPDRADVILPAAQVYLSFAMMAGTEWIYTPGVGVRDGLAIELFRKEEPVHLRQKYQQLISAVLSLGEKYEFDRNHATVVTAYALELFDAMKEIHRLGEKERLLLEIAALLHDIGYFVSMSRHHKHSFYLISESDIVGLSARDKLIVANIARYHRKSFPKGQHENLQDLDAKEKKIMYKLASILRVADALDRDHASQKMALSIKIRGNRIILRLPPAKERSFYRWTLSAKADLLNEVYGYQVEIN
jgi:exopolyphosphatase/guanosine-5'-triphosphate,3'-diphosphate pyrophosphatase